MMMAGMVLVLLIGGAPGAVAPTSGTGAGISSASVGPFAFNAAVDPTTGHAFVVGAEMDTRNGGFTGQGRISVLATRTGALLQTITAGRGSGVMMVDARAGHAFVANQGDMQWYQNADGANSYRAISPTVSILDTRTGATVRTVTLGGQVPYAMVVDTLTSRLFVASGPMPPNTPGVGGNVRVLDTRTGALVRIVPLHTIPPFTAGALAVDATAGRVFVALTNFTSQNAVGRLWVLDAGTGVVVRTVAGAAAARL